MKLYLKYIKITVVFFIVSISGCSHPSFSVPGYIEGEYTYIASTQAGTLQHLAVVRGQRVQKGDLLFELDPQPERATVQATQATIHDLESQAAFAKSQLQRQQKLYATRNTSAEALDQASTDLKTRSQQLLAERAQLIQNEWALQQKTRYAPVEGSVFDTFYRLGETVEAGHPVLALLAPDNIRVQFYVPEEQLATIRAGQTVRFRCDGCDGTTQATIDYISPEAEYTPPVIYSKDTRHKLVYLVRASMPPGIAQQFHPGQPVDVFWSSP